MATRYGRTFTTRRGRRGRYKYVNGRKVSFVATKNKRFNFKRMRKGQGYRNARMLNRHNRRY